MSDFKFPWKTEIPTNPAIPSPPTEGTPAHNLPLLFTPLKVRGLTLKNRISVSPM